MERYFKCLNAEDRSVILAEHRRGSSLRPIGRLLCNHHRTIALELTRGEVPGGHDPQVARLAADTGKAYGHYPDLTDASQNLWAGWMALGLSAAVSFGAFLVVRGKMHVAPSTFYAFKAGQYYPKLASD